MYIYIYLNVSNWSGLTILTPKLGRSPVFTRSTLPTHSGNRTSSASAVGAGDGREQSYGGLMAFNGG